MPKSEVTQTSTIASELLETMAARLAFARCMARVCEALLVRLCSAPGEPRIPHDEVRRFRDEEAAHFQLLCEGIESLGGDPLTPVAQTEAIAAQSYVLVRTIEDPETSLLGCLDVLLETERANVAGWQALLRLAQASGQHALGQRFSLVLQTEYEQLECVRHWNSTLAANSVQAAA